jgi:hypothetical protein
MLGKLILRIPFLNETELCGNLSLAVWDEETKDFGSCFEILALIGPAHFLLATTCAFQLGWETGARCTLNLIYSL